MLLTVVISLLTLNLVFSQKPSPCPNVLIYQPKNSEKNRWHAVVNLSSRETFRGIWLVITLDRPAELLGNIFGDVTSTNNKEFLIRSNNYVLEAGKVNPVRFFVKFNAASITPSVEEINLNGRTICSTKVEQTTVRNSSSPISNSSNIRPSSPDSRPITSLSIGSTSRPLTESERPDSEDFELVEPSRPNRPSSFTEPLEVVRPNRPSGYTDDLGTNLHERPPASNNGASNIYGTNVNNFQRPYAPNRETEDYNLGNNQGSSGLSVSPQDNNDFYPGDWGILNKPPTNPASLPNIQKNLKCGVVATRPRPLISNGQDTEPGQWPWHVALYHSKGVQLMYTCGGTLISTSHIVTAAHCVTKPRTNRPINPQNIVAYLGKYSLNKFGSEIQDRDVGDIYVHPQYNYSGYYNDIAILRLAEPIEFTNYVRPVCLWGENTNLNRVEGKLGTVVGWGFNENGILTTTLMQSQMPIVPLNDCLYSNREFFSQFTSDKSFCAGFRNGTSVCNGDSGGGMVFPRIGTSGSSTVWQIRGLVSVGVAFQGKDICDTSQYVVFTDVAKHLDWIQGILNRNP